MNNVKKKIFKQNRILKSEIPLLTQIEFKLFLLIALKSSFKPRLFK